MHCDCDGDEMMGTVDCLDITITIIVVDMITVAINYCT